ncbi:MAG: hypothetical protein Q4D63_02010 [Neisseria animaloris]|nr:hypothetical protein [Neisseria animaloris]
MLRASEKIKIKLQQRHSVTLEEVEECISNLDSSDQLFEDTREEHLTDPPTLWFIGETNMGRKLKVVLIPRDDGIILKTAYPPNQVEINLYNLLSKK